MRNTALAAALCLVAAPALADVPAGWKSHADNASPDQHAQAFVDGGDLPYPTFKQVLLPMDQFKGAKVMKNTDSLYYAELESSNPAKRTLYVIMPRGKSGTCRTEITFDGKTEDTAKKIGDSLRVK
jgi:hypothetical protein